MSLRVRVDPGPWADPFGRDAVVRIGRSPENDVRAGHHRVGGRWTVSRTHAELRWDGTRWSTLNLSARPGLLQVYEPGWEEVPVEPGRPWVPVRHRWAYALGRPGQQVHVVCETDDHGGPGVADGPEGTGADGPDEDLTTDLVGPPPLALTPLEQEVVRAYYSDFALLPRPATVAPRAHDDAARRLRRSRDSTRKAIERVNRRVAAVEGAPAVADGRNVSAEVGRWLARSGVLDPG